MILIGLSIVAVVVALFFYWERLEKLEERVCELEHPKDAQPGPEPRGAVEQEWDEDDDEAVYVIDNKYEVEVAAARKGPKKTET